MRLGRAIAIIRAAESKTQAQTAAEIGVSPQVLSRLETGKGCEASSLVAILAWLCAGAAPEVDLGASAQQPLPIGGEESGA